MANKRELIGDGFEHQVYQARTGDFVLKRPRVATVLLLPFVGGVNSVRRDIDNYTEMASQTDLVEVVKPRVIDWGRGYVMVQRRVNRDQSVTDIRARLVEAGIPQFVTRYDSNPENFISEKGVICFLDPTTPPILKLLGKIGLSRDQKFMRKMGKIVSRKRRNEPTITP